MRINVGCGHNPILGWRSIDNSYSVRFERVRESVYVEARKP